MRGSPEGDQPIAILAGGGRLPELVAASAVRKGRPPVVFAIAGEAIAENFAPAPVHVMQWGEIGKLFRLTREAGCREAVLIGSISHRPDFLAIRPDLGAIKLIPRILKLMTRGDGNLLDGVAAILEEHGVRVVSPFAIAPDLALPEGCLSGHLSADSLRDIEVASRAAREIGRQDIGQAAVAVGGAVVAVEDSRGTDALIEHVATLRKSDLAGHARGVLVKLLKEGQDGRHDLPTIGPQTAERAAHAGLAGVAAEAGRAMLVGREETIAAFRRVGLFLAGLPPAPSSSDG